jgi:hypothetical protein
MFHQRTATMNVEGGALRLSPSTSPLTLCNNLRSRAGVLRRHGRRRRRLIDIRSRSAGARTSIPRSPPSPSGAAGTTLTCGELRSPGPNAEKDPAPNSVSPGRHRRGSPPRAHRFRIYATYTGLGGTQPASSLGQTAALALEKASLSLKTSNIPSLNRSTKIETSEKVEADFKQRKP